MREKREIDKEDKKRISYFSIIIGVIFLLLLSRLYYLQILNGNSYKEKAVRNSLRNNIIKATRGKIYDVNGVVVADNSTGYKIIHRFTRSISANEKNLLLEMFKNGKNTINNLKEKEQEKLNEIYEDIVYIAKIAGNTNEEILDIFYKTPPTGFDKEIVVVEDLDTNIALKEVEKLPNDRIDIIEYNKRTYPYGSFASNVIGYVKLISDEEYKNLKDKGYQIDDLIGKKGVERQYDQRMHGIDGQEFVEVDVKGNVIKKLDEVQAIGGDNIYLSIEKELQDYMTSQYSGISGSFIAIDVKTGKIITFVSSPEIDLNLLSSKMSQSQWDSLINSSLKPLVNKGISGLYPAGSTFKIISGAAILESGISTGYTVYSSGSFTYGKVTFKDSHLNGHGYTNFYKSIEESVNTYYYDLILKIKRDKFFDIANSFGIGQRTGIDIPGENSGVLPTPEWKQKKFKNKRDQVWLPGDLINLSIGQGYLLVTPLQILMAYQAVANDGIIMQPTVVDRFVDSLGNVTINEPKQKGKLNISSNTIKEIKKALLLPVNGANGTAKILRTPNVKVSAKTGTAQNSSGKNHSWIAGYFEANNTQIAFVSLVEQGGYGGVAAGQKAKAFIEKYFNKGSEVGNESKQSEEN